MITLKEWLELVDYKITEGDDFYGYGGKSYILSSWNGKHVDGFSSDIIFDTKSQQVYAVEVHDYKNDRAYRLINPEYSGDKPNSQAWDQVSYIDLESDDDYMIKHQAIFAGEEYDTRCLVELELDEGLVNQLMRMAHEQDITFNKLIENILREFIDARN
jgi:hypothetical protein